MNTTQTNTCPYCLAEVRTEASVCNSCSAAHHSECLAANGGCAVLGCESGRDETNSASALPPPLPSPPRLPAPQPPAPPTVPPIGAVGGYPGGLPRDPDPDDQRVAHVVAVFNARRKSQGAVIALALLLGGVGAHRWYLGDTKTGWIFVALFVSGFFLVIPWVVALVWSLVDALNSRALTNAANERVWSELILGAGPGSFGRHGAGR